MTAQKVFLSIYQAKRPIVTRSIPDKSFAWIDPGCIDLEKEGKLDKADIYKNNYDAIKLALKRALNDEPSIDELIKNRHTIKHCMWEDSWDQK